MHPLRIYADFNGLVKGPKNPERRAVVLDTLGSLQDLSNAGVVLSEGLPIVAVDASDEVEDLEGHGTAQYDRDNKWWVVEFDEVGVRYVPAGDRARTALFLCVNCREPVLILPGELNDNTACKACGTSVFTPIQAPA